VNQSQLYHSYCSLLIFVHNILYIVFLNRTKSSFWKYHVLNKRVIKKGKEQVSKAIDKTEQKFEVRMCMFTKQNVNF